MAPLIPVTGRDADPASAPPPPPRCAARRPRGRGVGHPSSGGHRAPNPWCRGPSQNEHRHAPRACQLAPLIVLSALCAAAEAEARAGTCSPGAPTRAATSRARPSTPRIRTRFSSCDPWTPSPADPAAGRRGGDPPTRPRPFRPERRDPRERRVPRRRRRPGPDPLGGPRRGGERPVRRPPLLLQARQLRVDRTPDALWHVSSYAPRRVAAGPRRRPRLLRGAGVAAPTAERRATLLDPGDWCQSDV